MDETDKVVQPVRPTRLNEKQGTTPCTACWFMQNGMKRHDRGTMPVFRKSVGLSVVGREELWASEERDDHPDASKNSCNSLDLIGSGRVCVSLCRISRRPRYLSFAGPISR
jgi:hypothetical protein